MRMCAFRSNAASWRRARSMAWEGRRGPAGAVPAAGAQAASELRAREALEELNFTFSSHSA